MSQLAKKEVETMIICPNHHFFRLEPGSVAEVRYGQLDRLEIAQCPVCCQKSQQDLEQLSAVCDCRLGFDAITCRLGCVYWGGVAASEVGVPGLVYEKD